MKTLKSTLDDVAKAKQHRTVVKKLKQNESFILKTLLQGNFSDRISFPFPSGPPPFIAKTDEVEVTDQMIMGLGKCTVGNKKVAPVQKEVEFIKLLESVHKDDAEIICLMKDGELEQKYPMITLKAVKEAFPNLI